MLNHPNVIRFFGIFTGKEQEKFMVFEYVNGGSLGEFLKAKVIPNDVLTVMYASRVLTKI